MLLSLLFSSFVNLPELCQKKAYFSGKQKLYGYKAKLYVFSTELCTWCTKHHRGLVSDLEMFCQNHNFHKEDSKKVIRDFQLRDQALLGETSSDYWAVSADKDYQGATKGLRVKHPKREYWNIALTPLEEGRNRQISSDRIIVKKIFGCLTMPWTLLSHK